MPLAISIDRRVYHIEVEAPQIEEWAAAFERASLLRRTANHAGWEAEDEDHQPSVVGFFSAKSEKEKQSAIRYKAKMAAEAAAKAAAKKG